MAQVWMGSGLRKVRVPNPRKSFVAASMCFYLISMYARFMPHNYPQRDNTAVVVIRAWFVHMNI